MLSRLILAWVSNCVALLVAAAVIPALSYHDDLGTLVLSGLVLGLVNLGLRPLVILVSLPILVISLGMALVLVNALMLWLTSAIVPDLRVGGFWSTIGGALVISLVNLVLHPTRRRLGRARQQAHPR